MNIINFKYHNYIYNFKYLIYINKYLNFNLNMLIFELANYSKQNKTFKFIRI